MTEAEVLSNARFMAEHLLAFGWDTVVVDIQWYEPNARAGGYNDDADVVLDPFGRPTPAVNRFPSAADGRGFAPLAESVHELGLKFGLHIMRGVPRRAVAADLPVHGSDLTARAIADTSDYCTWNGDNWGLDFTSGGAAEYYRSLAALFSEWGVDFVKADDMLWPYHSADIEALSSALAEAPREIALSLSPGVDVSTLRADHLAEHATMWRISNDLWDNWDDVLDIFQRMARWAPLSKQGAWADADMLPLGHIGIRAERGQDRQSLLTTEEQRTMMTLWGITRSPLFVGGDLPTSGGATLELLTNSAVLDVHAHGRSPHEILREETYVVWISELPGKTAVAVFNLDNDPRTIDLSKSSLGVTADEYDDGWQKRTVPAPSADISIELNAHGAALLIFS